MWVTAYSMTRMSQETCRLKRKVTTGPWCMWEGQDPSPEPQSFCPSHPASTALRVCSCFFL